MQYRTLGKTGFSVSTISFGAWALGGDWGQVEDAESLAALRKAVDVGINFFDTADVYGDGRSERLVGQLRREVGDTIRIATKAGRRLNPHTADGYDLANLRAFVERSLQNLGVECLDLLQLHCPPTDVYYRPEVFAALDELVREGKLLHYGVSVERVEEGLKALEFPGVATVQIIYNLFRQRPAELFFRKAEERGVGILARVPLASGLLSGSMDKTRVFSDQDHRKYNRHGEAFDRGETFSGVDFELGLELAEEIRKYVPEGASLAQFALRWILMDPAVSCAIPGAKRPEQVAHNARAADLASIGEPTLAALKELYQTRLRAGVHQRW
jgi:aryl-alcohol dehydrogenase-like predicted oxidoreductase